MIDCVFLWLAHQQAGIVDGLLFVCVLFLGGVSTARHKAPNARKLLRIDSLIEIGSRRDSCCYQSNI
jgi:hypothetical protein